jgi:hypothetical protein
MQMYPWLWFWAPQFHYPFSGSVAQKIAPDTNWFFDSIPPEAGIGDVERKIFEVASYGRQLGLMAEVVLALADGNVVSEEKASQSLQRLKEMYLSIENVKRTNSARTAEAALHLLRKLREIDQAQLIHVLAVLSAETPNISSNPDPDRRAFGPAGGAG